MRSKNEEMSHFLASLWAIEFWKDSSFSELSDTQRYHFIPQALNLPQNSIAQLILFELHVPRTTLVIKVVL